MKIRSNMPANAVAVTGINVTTEREPIDKLARKLLAQYLPQRIPLELPPLAGHLGLWEPCANYVVAGGPHTGADALVLTFAQNFAASGGHIIWIGITEDLGRLSERLMFKIAGLELATAGTRVQLDAVAQIKLVYARAEIDKLWIDFCNVEDCGDTEVEEEFLASMSSFKPTMIVVDESIFDQATLDPFEVLVRQTHAMHMVDELRRANPMSSVLWQVPVANSIDTNFDIAPTLRNLTQLTIVAKADVVMITHVDINAGSELVVLKNDFGPTGTKPLNYRHALSTWSERDATTNC